jgi:hypothetical protein
LDDRTARADGDSHGGYVGRSHECWREPAPKAPEDLECFSSIASDIFADAKGASGAPELAPAPGLAGAPRRAAIIA